MFRYFLNFSTKRTPKQVLLNSRRFDICAKFIYAKYREKEIHSEWYKHLYLEHIKVWNNFIEKAKYTGRVKQGPRQFLSQFDQLLDSVKTKGFDPSISKIWVDKRNNLIHGAHRLAACLLYDLTPELEVHPEKHGQKICDYRYFFDRKDYISQGLSRHYADRMALEYVYIKPSCTCLVIFPSAKGKDKQIQNIVNKYGEVVYSKNVMLTKIGAFNFMKILYKGEKWVGNWNNNFSGLWDKVEPCFADFTSPLQFILLDSQKQDWISEMKNRIRKLFVLGNHSAHTSDTIVETREISQALLNENSIHFLNYSQLTSKQSNFLKLFPIFKKRIKQLKIDPDDVCITSSAVLAVYGLRDCRDIDFLIAEKNPLSKITNDIKCHTTELKHYPFNPDEIIYNPDHHFYYDGIKFTSLDLLERFKGNRQEKKDIEDITLIHSLR